MGSFVANANSSFGASLPSMGSNVAPSPSLRYAVLLDHCRTTETSEAHQLLSSVARSLSSNLQNPPTASGSEGTFHSLRQSKTSGSGRAGVSSTSSDPVSTSGRSSLLRASGSITAASMSTDVVSFSFDVAPVSTPPLRQHSRRRSAGTAAVAAAAAMGHPLKPSGSFPDALALLLQERTTPSTHSSSSVNGVGPEERRTSAPSPLRPEAPPLTCEHSHVTLVASLQGAPPSDGLSAKPGKADGQNVPAELLDKCVLPLPAVHNCIFISCSVVYSSFGCLLLSSVMRCSHCPGRKRPI
jgi:hypothetical protein